MNDRDGLLRKARRSKNHNDWIRYKTFKNRVNNVIKRAKSKYHKNLLDENISKREVFWKHIKTLFPTKMKQTCSKSFIINDIATTNEREISNGFCSFFHNAVNNLKANSFRLKDFIWSKPKVLSINTANRFHFRYVSVPEVKRLLKQTDSKKSDGPDLIPARLIKDCAHELAPSITHLVNVILETSTIPNDFKIGRISAIYKSGEKNQLNNYRPITVLPILSKIMEKGIYNQLTVYLEKNNLLSSRQFGFRKGKSTELAATLFFDDVHRAMDRGELTGTIFIDLSKAFDTVSHSVLLSKLSASICSREKELFSDDLFNQWQYVQCSSSILTSKPVYIGVPQGSILSPLFLILHFNDAQQQLIRCKIITYADDTIIYFHDKDISIIEKVLNTEFTYLSDWLTENELILNLQKDKTETIVFGTKLRLSKINSNINVECHSIKVNRTYTKTWVSKSIPR